MDDVFHQAYKLTHTVRGSLKMKVYALIASVIAIFHGFICVVVPGMCMGLGFVIGFPSWIYAITACLIGLTITYHVLKKECLLTTAENYFRQLAGSGVYNGSFLVHYLHLNSNLSEVIETIVGFLLGTLFFICLLN